MTSVRTFAYYLPQFHPIPENDLWWGKGFTEWTKVTQAQPIFEGHAQPRLPRDLGFYDLRLADSREAQVELARQHGVDGFIYYHYWFHGRQVLERPFNEVLESNSPDFPFALCWANEHWHRNWDGRSGDVLLEQNYSEDDDRAHMQWIIRAMRDSRYIRIDDKPLLIVHRANLLPNPARTAEIWREEANNAGIGEIYLAYSENMGSFDNPASVGFDAAIEFAPEWQISPGTMHETLETHDYLDTAAAMLAKPDTGYRRFPCVTPGFDNTPRKGADGYILTDNHPDLYKGWVASTVQREIERGHNDVVVFVNAWNEWAEGAILEPCSVWGTQYLEAHAAGIALGLTPAQPEQPGDPIITPEPVAAPAPAATPMPTPTAPMATSTGAVDYVANSQPASYTQPAPAPLGTFQITAPTPMPEPQPMPYVDNTPLVQPEVGLTVALVTNGGPEQMMNSLRSALDTCKGVGLVDFLVVDNATTDETAGVLEALGETVRSIRCETALTPQAAWMLAKQAAKGEYVLLLSNDVTLTEGWLEPVIIALASDPTCRAATPSQVFNGQTFPSQPLTSISGVSLLVRAVTDVSAISEAKYVADAYVTYAPVVAQPTY